MVNRDLQEDITMPKKKIVICSLLGIAVIFSMTFLVLYYNAYQSFKAYELCSSINPYGWEDQITYSMLSPELQKIISEEEFSDPTPETRFQMYKKLEGLILDDRPIESFDGSSYFWKTPYCESYDIDGVSYQVEFRIDVKCHFDKMEVRNFTCYIWEM